MNITMHEAAKAWAEGKDVEWSGVNQTQWHALSVTGFCFSQLIDYRIKPEITTSLTDAQLGDAYAHGWNASAADNTKLGNYRLSNGIRAVADAAIKQYIKDTQK